MDKKASILIVEDEIITAFELSDTMRRLGYAVAGEAVSAEEAVHLALETRPDLILMDIRLKGDGDGVDAAARILETYHVPIIYLTAYADRRTREKADATGAFRYLIKPFSDEDLATAVMEALAVHG